MTRRRQRLGALWALGLVLGTALSAPAAGQGLLFADERSRLPGREGPGVASSWGDVDGDGDQDLMRVTANALDVLLQQPDGTFQRRQSLAPLALSSGARAVSVAAGYLRPGAGLPDIVVGVTGGDSLLFLNDGTGRFQRRPISPFPRPAGFSGATTQVLVANIDGAHGDDVVAFHDGALPQLFLLQAGGGFVSRGSAYFPPGFFLQSPVGVAADFTGDGHLDLVVIRRGVPSVPVLLASQSGTSFNARAMAFASVSPVAASAVDAGDLTGDNVPDLAIATINAAAAAGVGVLANNGQGIFSAAPIVSFGSGAVRDVVIADFDNDRQADLGLLEADGALGVALRRGGVFPALNQVLSPAPRQMLHAVDLEGDGDVDLHALGARTEDSLLLGDGGGAFHATEEVTMPAGMHAAPFRFVLLDATGEGDLDLCGYAPNGVPLTYANDGAARFRPRLSMLPSLFPAQVLDLAPLSVSRPGSGDLAVLGSRPGGGPIGVSLLVRVGGRLVDETAARWQVAQPNSLSAIAVGDIATGTPGTTGLDDIIGIDDTGQLWLFENQSGVLSVRPGAFGSTSISGAVQLLIGRVDNDARPDLVVLRSVGPPVVFMGGLGGSFQRVPQPIVGSFPARRGVLAELTGDSIADLLILDRNRSGNVFLLRGLGGGTFADHSAQAPSPLPSSLTSIALLGRGTTQRPGAVVFGSGTEPDVVFGRQGGVLSVRRPLPARGSRETTDVLVGDLDTDGDEDIVLVRGPALPRVLFQQSTQFQSLSTAQLGRRATLRFRAPGTGVVVLFAGIFPTRVVLPPYGVLRLQAIGFQQVVALPISALAPVDLPIETSPVWPALELPLQSAFFDTVGGTARLGNLEFLRLVDF